MSKIIATFVTSVKTPVPGGRLIRRPHIMQCEPKTTVSDVLQWYKNIVEGKEFHTVGKLTIKEDK